MEQVGGARTGAREQLDPGSDEPFVGGILDGGKDAIGRIRAILVGGLEGNGRSQWLRRLKRGRVVERVDVDPGEEAGGWVGSPGCPSEPAASVGCQPAAGRARASERVTCAEPPRGKKKSAETTRPPRSKIVLPARFACYLHGVILVRQPRDGASAVAAAPEAQWRAESPSKPDERSLSLRIRRDRRRERTFSHSLFRRRWGSIASKMPGKVRGRAAYAGTRSASRACAVPAAAVCAGARSASSVSSCFSACTCSWRTRSRVSPSPRPTVSSDCGSP